MTRWILLASLPVASSCTAQQWYTTQPVPVESMPEGGRWASSGDEEEFGSNNKR